MTLRARSFAPRRSGAWLIVVAAGLTLAGAVLTLVASSGVLRLGL